MYAGVSIPVILSPFFEGNSHGNWVSLHSAVHCYFLSRVDVILCMQWNWRCPRYCTYVSMYRISSLCTELYFQVALCCEVQQVDCVETRSLTPLLLTNILRCYLLMLGNVWCSGERGNRIVGFSEFLSHIGPAFPWCFKTCWNFPFPHFVGEGKRQIDHDTWMTEPFLARLLPPPPLPSPPPPRSSYECKLL